MISYDLKNFRSKFSKVSKLNIIKTFILTFFAFSVSSNAIAHQEGSFVPCDIRLVFGVDDNGMSLISYNLEMQVQNHQGRIIKGVSVHWLNAQSIIIGNSNAICGNENEGIEPAHFGSCQHTVQRLSERLLDRLGQETWTEIVNSEMRNFNEVQMCRIIGYQYGNTSVKNY